MVDFEWDTFWAPTLTQESSEFADDPPFKAWPVGGPVSDQFAISTRARKEGVLEEAVDLLRWFSVPENLELVQREVGTSMPNVKGVGFDDRFKSAHEMLTGTIGETQMFVWENVKMDIEAATGVGQAWQGWMLDQIGLEDAIAAINKANDGFADRYVEQEGLDC